jgi:hypothetical protein
VLFIGFQTQQDQAEVKELTAVEGKMLKVFPEEFYAKGKYMY